jgi:hypothetical protein
MDNYGSGKRHRINCEVRQSLSLAILEKNEVPHGKASNELVIGGLHGYRNHNQIDLCPNFEILCAGCACEQR